MATRKKKPNVIVSAEAAEALNSIGIDAVKEVNTAIKKAKKESKKSSKMDMPGTIGSAKIVLPEVWPKVAKGSHLTVTTYEDGRTKLEWDDEALLRDVREAIASVETVKKPARKKKNASV